MRIKRAVNAVKKRRKILKLAKGYYGNKSKSYRIAREAVMKSLGRSSWKRSSSGGAEILLICTRDERCQ